MSAPILPMSEEEIGHELSRHGCIPDPRDGELICDYCELYWPCPTARLIATVEKAEDVIRHVEELLVYRSMQYQEWERRLGVYFGKHSKPPIQARSKSEYKRLKAQGVEVLQPALRTRAEACGELGEVLSQMEQPKPKRRWGLSGNAAILPEQPKPETCKEMIRDCVAEREGDPPCDGIGECCLVPCGNPLPCAEPGHEEGR